MKWINFLLVFVLGVLFIPSSYAQSNIPLPMAFYGSVSIDGNPSPSGIEIIAMIDGVEMGRIITEVGKYGDPANFGQKLTLTGNLVDVGKTIQFFIKTPTTELIQADQQAVFVNVFESDENLEKITNNLDLTFPGYCGDSFCSGETCSSCSLDCGSCPLGGGGGGTTCTEDWLCSEWSECKDRTQTRLCFDENNCRTEKNKPIESRSCELLENGFEIICSTGDRICKNNDVFECQEGGITYNKVETCEFGCSDGKCNSESEEVETSNNEGISLTGFFLQNPVLSLYGILIIIVIIFSIVAIVISGKK